jgi:hypothetical protein
MSTNTGHKPSPQATLASVVAEMARPRMAESVKSNADTLANGGHNPAILAAEKRQHAEARSKSLLLHSLE